MSVRTRVEKLEQVISGGPCPRCADLGVWTIKIIAGDEAWPTDQPPACPECGRPGAWACARLIPSPGRPQACQGAS